MKTEAAEQSIAQGILALSMAPGAAEQAQTQLTLDLGARHGHKNCAKCPCHGLCRRNHKH
jgi:hypothetical protein